MIDEETAPAFGQEFFLRQKPVEMDRLIEVARVQLCNTCEV